MRADRTLRRVRPAVGTTRPSLRCGFTITEVLVVVGVIIILVGILIPAMASIRRSTRMTASMGNLRQVATWMSLYNRDNREFIVPSEFDYSAEAAAGRVIKVRSDPSLAGHPLGDLQYRGTWTDILWTENEVQVFPNPGGDLTQDYRFDSPDKDLYDNRPDFDMNPLRSTQPNSRGVAGGTGPLPFGTGANEPDQPGYFAANQFFDSTESGFFAMGQIKAPERSMYAVDSFAGETIGNATPPSPDNFQPAYDIGGGTAEVDFRYGDVCLMLFLDGRVDPQQRWKDLAELQADRKVRITNLTGNTP